MWKFFYKKLNKILPNNITNPDTGYGLACHTPILPNNIHLASQIDSGRNKNGGRKTSIIQLTKTLIINTLTNILNVFDFIKFVTENF